MGTLRLLAPTECVMHRLAWYFHDADPECLEHEIQVAMRHPVDLKRLEGRRREHHAGARGRTAAMDVARRLLAESRDAIELIDEGAPRSELRLRLPDRTPVPQVRSLMRYTTEPLPSRSHAGSASAVPQTEKQPRKRLLSLTKWWRRRESNPRSIQ